MGDRFIAKMLFENNTQPVYYYFNDGSILLIHAHLNTEFMNLEVVTRQRFEMELDHIRLFGERSDDRLILRREERISDELVIDFLDYSDLPLNIEDK